MHKKRPAWNRGRLLGQRPPLKARKIWSLRITACGEGRRPCAINLAIDGKVRGCDLVSLRVRDVYHGNVVASRAIVMRRKTHRPLLSDLPRSASVLDAPNRGPMPFGTC